MSDQIRLRKLCQLPWSRQRGRYRLDLVQGTDYAYTLQGWLKGINGDRLDPATDMGHDGDLADAETTNDLVGHDAFALSLGYYGDADYKGIGPSWDDDQPATIAQRPFAPMGTSGTLEAEHKPLHNGNIAHTVNSLQPFGTWSANGGQPQVLAQVYHYDQLNRLKKARGIIGLDGNNSWDGITDAEPYRYQSLYSYDANGNITYCDRHDEEGLRYDALRYHYQLSGAAGRLLRNRLYLVKDSEADIEVTDIGDYPNHEPTFQDPYNAAGNINSLNSYSYDALGNLTKDATAGISAIDWTVAGKVKTVHREGGSPLLKLGFGYGASGQRIMKQVGEPGTDAGAYREHYVRDAQGNIMATYRYTNDASVSLMLNERPLYGSSRLGALRKELEVYNAPTSVNPGANPVQLVDLNYELTDHLGNVSAVVTGRLLTNLFGATPCQADLVSATGYEVFGGVQTGRHWNSGVALNGFNGMRKENELNGEHGMAYDFGARLYDPRVGRWLSLDPLSKEYPALSAYAFVANSPVLLKDLNGKRIFIFYDSGKRDALGGIQYDMYEYGSALDVPDDQFVRETIAALDLIRSVHEVQMDPGEPTPKQVIDDLVGDGVMVSIQFAPDQVAGHSVVPEQHYSRITFDNLLGFTDINVHPGEDDDGSRGGFMPPFVLLHHELRHAWHALANGPVGLANYKSRSDPHKSVLIDYERTTMANGRTFPNNEEYVTSMNDTPLMDFFGLGKRLSYKGQPTPVQSSTSLTPSSGLTQGDLTGSSQEVKGVDYSQSVLK